MKNLRKLIKEALTEFEPIILESLQIEAQKNMLVDVQVENMLNKMELLALPEGADTNVIKQEIKNKIHSKFNKAQLKSYSYNDFYIVKLGVFSLKTGDKNQRLFFHMGDVVNGEKRNAAFFYIYVYHDKIQIIYYASEFYEDDNSLIKNAQEFIKAKRINLVTKTEQGKIIIDTSLSSTNEIDITNYGSAAAVASSVVKPRLAKQKKSYRAGDPLKHEKFGRGIITKVRQQGMDAEGNQQYYVTVKFPDKERTLLMAPKKGEPALG